MYIGNKENNFCKPYCCFTCLYVVIIVVKNIELIESLAQNSYQYNSFQVFKADYKRYFQFDKD